MLAVAITISFAAIGCSIALTAWRLFRGPDPVDRALAFDTLYINAVALLLLAGTTWGSALAFDGALLIALMGFVGTAAIARYLERGQVID